jgi:hypothetical protein
LTIGLSLGPKTVNEKPGKQRRAAGQWPSFTEELQSFARHVILAQS